MTPPAKAPSTAPSTPPASTPPATGAPVKAVPVITASTTGGEVVHGTATSTVFTVKAGTQVWSRKSVSVCVTEAGAAQQCTDAVTDEAGAVTVDRPGTGSYEVVVKAAATATNAAATSATVSWKVRAAVTVSAAEFVTHLARMSGLPKTAARERASEALRHVGLYEERYRQIGGYSTGMKQRVKLAQALVHDPDLLLLDEPTNGLDPAGRDAMLNLVHRIGNEFGISVVVCSHLLGEVERICDSLIAIEGGRLLRADRISSMTEASDILAVEVADGTDELATALAERGLAVTREGRLLLVPLESDEAYDRILHAVTDLDLNLHRLDQRRHRVAELFTKKETADV
ncbi:ABC transporter ATP-binding protein [Actinoplanes philippinensis]